LLFFVVVFCCCFLLLFFVALLYLVLLLLFRIVSGLLHLFAFAQRFLFEDYLPLEIDVWIPEIKVGFEYQVRDLFVLFLSFVAYPPFFFRKNITIA
jgi:hypothetical protein